MSGQRASSVNCTFERFYMSKTAPLMMCVFVLTESHLVKANMYLKNISPNTTQKLYITTYFSIIPHYNNEPMFALAFSLNRYAISCQMQLETYISL